MNNLKNCVDTGYVPEFVNFMPKGREGGSDSWELLMFMRSRRSKFNVPFLVLLYFPVLIYLLKVCMFTVILSIFFPRYKFFG
jgi:hypothetical protein